MDLMKRKFKISKSQSPIPNEILMPKGRGDYLLETLRHLKFNRVWDSRLTPYKERDFEFGPYHQDPEQGNQVSHFYFYNLFPGYDTSRRVSS